MSDTLIIPSRFRGPPNSGNGGYVAGAIAERFPVRPDAHDDAAVEVTLRAPIPLDTPLEVQCSGESQLRLTLGEQPPRHASHRTCRRHRLSPRPGTPANTRPRCAPG